MTACSVLVLAGGRSRRFGRDKMDADWRGSTLRDHVLRRMAELSDDILVLAAHGSAPDAEAGGVRVVVDRADSPGPLVAVVDGLAAARHEMALVVAADMPVVPMRTLDLLLTELGVEGRQVVGLTLDGRIEPLPVAVRRDAVADAVRAMVEGGARRMGALRDLAGAYGIPEAEWRRLDPNGDSLRDIDTEEDLRLLLNEPEDG